jgi:DNA-binding response OmpR family regulator
MADLSHVLVVDDSPRMVGLLACWLRRAGFQVTGVTTVQEALDFLGKQVTDWVITDVMLSTGDRDGHASIRSCQATSSTGHRHDRLRL